MDVSILSGSGMPSSTAGLQQLDPSSRATGSAPSAPSSAHSPQASNAGGGPGTTMQADTIVRTSVAGNASPTLETYRRAINAAWLPSTQAPAINHIAPLGASPAAHNAPPESAGGSGAASGALHDTVNFGKGVAEGVRDGLTGMVTGLGSMVKGAYDLATSSKARKSAADTTVKDAKAAGQFVKTAVTDPSKAAGQIGSTVNAAWNNAKTAYHQAAANGDTAESIGKVVGQGAVLAASAIVPGGPEAEGAATVGDAGRVAETASEIGKPGRVASNVAEVLSPTNGVVDSTKAPGAGDSVHSTAASSSIDSATASHVFHPRSKGEYEALARDPARGGKIDAKSQHERRVGLNIEARGDIPGPITRDPSGSAEFVDSSGQKWDVKGFNSSFPARKGGFDAVRDANAVDRSLASNEHVMLDTTKMSADDVKALRAEGEHRGWGNRVLWWP